MRMLLSEYPDEPIFNMKAVEQQTAISAATLRAWERRYTLIEPKRTASGYRLYSERDVALLRWVRSHMNDGLTVSRVVAMLENMRENNEAILVESSDDSLVLSKEAPMPPNVLVDVLYEAMISLDTGLAHEIMQHGFAMYTLPALYIEIITPVLVQIGEAWQRGELSITVEHFASNYLRGRLLALMQVYPHRLDMPMIFVGCAPSEQHEIGSLIFSVMLRQQGYNVIYLGQDVPIDDVLETVAQEHPAMLCLSASREPAALLLTHVQEILNKGELPVPIFAYGGRAFDQNPDLRRMIPGNYLGADPRESINVVNNLIRSQRSV